MRTTLAILATTVAACSSESAGQAPAADPRIQVPDLIVEPADANGFTIVAPKVTGIMPGESYEYCTWTDKILTEDTFIRGASGFQSKTGHHTVLFYTEKPEPAGTQRICTEDDMGKLRFVIGAGGEGQAKANDMPGDLALYVPKGSQLIINHHYLNATGKPLEAQSAMNVRLLPPGKAFTRAASAAFLDTKMMVPAGVQEVEVKCKLTKELKMFTFFPHMHRWGQHITVDHVHEGKPNRLFDVEWEEGFTFSPPTLTRAPTEPFVLSQGDEINIHCKYNNNTGSPLGFGLEMCVAFGQTIDADAIGNLACDAGAWTGF